jgi:hypothetical protein
MFGAREGRVMEGGLETVERPAPAEPRLAKPTTTS